MQFKNAPTLTLTLPRPTEVTALRLTPAGSVLPTHPSLVAVDLGDGPQVRTLENGEHAGAQTIDLHPRVTDTVRISLLNWDDVIDRTALGFDHQATRTCRVTALGPAGAPIASADAATNRDHAPSTSPAARDR